MFVCLAHNASTGLATRQFVQVCVRGEQTH